MHSLPNDPCIKCLVFGKSDSGKTTFVYDYATSILNEYSDSLCLIIARKSKAERKLVDDSIIHNNSNNDSISCFDRILYKWATDQISLIQIASGLHIYQDQPLELLVVEDLLEFVPAIHANAMISLFLNAISVFPTCRFIITMTPKKEANIVNFRLAMTHYVNTYTDSGDGGFSRRIGAFPKNLAKATEEIRQCLGDVPLPQ
ncbi:hypothetical protein TRFO_05130 [Tritrichomonas foetus]|uniref:Thymidine kinase n=1 Tax=Tritrichomonas foetus TaxID=1144522 RepID=A0A1J4K8I0_9EUKA|nr:hypothetical protein TRFO_05130 [Tritrichomonas foetus]|eukprot:OHT07515.1 hypothetical protein TRFO_05130 [Tritrichomonas foetus]